VGDANVDGQGSLDAYAAAHAGTYHSANAGVPRSLGTGSIDLDRGSLQVQIETGSLIGGLLGSLLYPVLQLLSGTELTGQNQLFDSLEFLTMEWSGARWYDSQWSGARWYGARWYGARWYGARWYNASWYGARWYGIAWE
jgi:hypothetical protein